MIMCLGINSPGTLKEVIRGYLGDRNSSNIFNNDEEIKFLLNSFVPAYLYLKQAY